MTSALVVAGSSGPVEAAAPVDTGLLAWYERVAGAFGPLPDTGPVARRARYEEITTLLDSLRPRATVAHRDVDLHLAGRTLKARLYHPGGTPPLLVYLHGGGWVVGSIPSHDHFCARAAAESGVALLSVEYRLAPEHGFPMPMEDAVDAVLWAHAHAAELGCDGLRLGVGGDSSGAHLAAVASLQLRTRNESPLSFQWLLYPALDPSGATASWRAFGEGPGLGAADMRWYWQQLGADLSAQDARLAPSRAASLAGLPPAWLVTAERDLLRDEGEDYAALLHAAGNRVECVRATGMTHGFARLGAVSAAADRWVGVAAAALRRGMAA